MPSILRNPTNGQILIADHAGDFGSGPATTANSLIIGTPTDVQMDCTSLSAGTPPTSGAGRASAKIDFGSDRPPLFALSACTEHGTAPSDGSAIEFFMGFSPNATAGTGNPAGLTGADEAFTWTRGKQGQLMALNALQLENTEVNIGYIGVFRPLYRYGMLVMVNTSGATLHNVMDEFHITLTPVEYDES